MTDSKETSLIDAFAKFRSEFLEYISYVKELEKKVKNSESHDRIKELCNPDEYLEKKVNIFYEDFFS